jgi:hypothetical protein
MTLFLNKWYCINIFIVEGIDNFEYDIRLEFKVGDVKREFLVRPEFPKLEYYFKKRGVYEISL